MGERPTHIGQLLSRSPLLLLVFLVPLLAGCPQYADPRVPNEIQKLTDPGSGRDYFLYAPSGYDAAQPAPLVVLCHGTTPWDNALRQIRDWVRLAEDKGFIVVAPRLKGTRGDFTPKADTQIARQRSDEETILGVVRHVQGAYRVAPRQVFLAGWSAGGFAVLHTGLRNPDVFRALAVLQGNFKPEYCADIRGRIDPYQPVFVLYGSTDVLTGGESRACVDWLYEQNAYVIDGLIPGPHRSHPQVAHDFFEKVVREIPWMRLRSFVPDPRDPFSVQFKAPASFEPEMYHWDFGDGGDSPIASPTHTYTDPGEYKVTLVVGTGGEKQVTRSMRVAVPHATVQYDPSE